MPQSIRVIIVALMLFGAGIGLAVSGNSKDAEPTETLAPPDQFKSIADEKERAAAIFTEMGKVLQHPRCLNCHPRTDQPSQGDEMRPHMPPVSRGPDGLGMPAMRCTTCHGEENFSFGADRGSIPGHEPWHLAPASMAWQGRTLSEICEQIKDPARNGGKSLEELHKHNAEDGLVGWGWKPGNGKTPAPGSQELFGALTAAWIENGAHCPSS